MAANLMMITWTALSLGSVLPSKAEPATEHVVRPVVQAGSEVSLPTYSHIFVIIEENKDFDQIVGGTVAPHIAEMARSYGIATHFYGEVHPSEANYVALLGGDTFGIHDDDAYYCHAGMSDPHCQGSGAQDYANHTVYSAFLGSQLEAKGLTWKGYYEDLPEPGSLVVEAGSVTSAGGLRHVPFYASKHSGFLNFAAVQSDPHRNAKLVGFDQLKADIDSDHLPSFALIVPNQCNEMHGIGGDGLPAYCQGTAQLIARGDEVINDMVVKLMKTKTWKSKDNVAIVITFDEGTGGDREGCCGVTPKAPSNYGGGHIPTLVLTNHGPRGVSDSTPYSHYSLLRTFEDLFGLGEHLGHAGDKDAGVVTMAPLFATSPH